MSRGAVLRGHAGGLRPSGKAASSEALAALPPREYLEHFDVGFYLRDALCHLLARARGDGRSVPDFLGDYLEAILRGEHVLHRSYRYISSTVTNRLAFVRLLRQAVRGVPDPAATAVTVADFHDIVLQLCADFPRRVVEDAAAHARRADPQEHHILGDSAPFGSKAAAGHGDGAAAEATVSDASMLVFSSLLSHVELAFAFHRAFDALAEAFAAAAAAGAGADEGVLRLERSEVLRLLGSSCDSKLRLPEFFGALLAQLPGSDSFTFDEVLAGMADYLQCQLEFFDQQP